jgi:outer membrane protein assembly factor BamB
MPLGTMNRPLLALGFLWILRSAMPLQAGDWPQFRGPTGQGIAEDTSVPLEWSTQRHVRWKTAVPGAGWSSPVLGGGHVYLTTAVTGESGSLSLRVLSFSAATGAPEWNVDVFGPDTAQTGSLHSKNGYASPTPVLEGNRIYVHFGHNGTACVDHSGKVIWRNAQLRYSPVHGSGGSPALVDDKLIFSADGASDPTVIALDKETGSVAWTVKRTSDAAKKFSFSTPLLISVQNRPQLVTPGSGVVSALDPTDGREIWRVRYGQGYSVVPRPVFAHGLIFLGTGYDRPTVLAIRPDGQGDVTETHVAWTLTKSAPNTPSLLVVGDELYMVSDGGIASCVDARTGKTHWQERVGGNFSASPLFAGNRIYLQSEEGVGTVLQPGKTFRVLATNSLEERSLASYAAADRSLFIRTAGHLYRIQE